MHAEFLADLADSGQPATFAQRQAALMLYAMIDTDRQWMLEQLPAGQRGPLMAMLNELAVLGIPADATLQASLADAAVRAPGAPCLSPAEKLRAAAIDELLDLLRDEPDALVARLLAAHEWPWHEELLSGIGAPRKNRIQDRWETLRGTASRATIGLALDTALFELLSERLEERRTRRASDTFPRGARNVERGGAGRHRLIQRAATSFTRLLRK